MKMNNWNYQYTDELDSDSENWLRNLYKMFPCLTVTRNFYTVSLTKFYRSMFSRDIGQTELGWKNW